MSEKNDETPANTGQPEWLRSPEFQEAVAAGVAAAMAQLAAAREGAGSAASSDDPDWVRRLALAIGEVTHQGSGRKPVDPGVLAAREAAAVRMHDILIELKALGNTPVYKLRGKVQLPLGDKGEAIIEPKWIGNDHIQYDTEVAWDGVPNLAMVPVNPLAERVYAAFCESIGSDNSPDLQGQSLAMTPGGVVVTGRAAATIVAHGPGAARRAQEAPQIGMPGPVGRQGESAALIRRHQPPAKIETHVLGTIAAPAVQNA